MNLFSGTLSLVILTAYSALTIAYPDIKSLFFSLLFFLGWIIITVYLLFFRKIDQRVKDIIQNITGMKLIGLGVGIIICALIIQLGNYNEYAGISVALIGVILMIMGIFLP